MRKHGHWKRMKQLIVQNTILTLRFARFSLQRVQIWHTRIAAWSRWPQNYIFRITASLSAKRCYYRHQKNTQSVFIYSISSEQMLAKCAPNRHTFCTKRHKKTHMGRWYARLDHHSGRNELCCDWNGTGDCLKYVYTLGNESFVLFFCPVR
jgi:hypothetical protein